MWIVDLLLVLPSFLIIAILSPTFRGKTWLVFVRAARGVPVDGHGADRARHDAVAAEREYVLAARFMGVPGWQIIFRHILPNMSSLLIIDATINVSVADPRRGRAVVLRLRRAAAGRLARHADRRRRRRRARPIRGCSTSPPGSWSSLVLAVNLVGDGLRDALDPNAGRCT